jgi:hypothetical protein
VTKHYNIILSRSTMFGTMFGDQTLVIASSDYFAAADYEK